MLRALLLHRKPHHTTGEVNSNLPPHLIPATSCTPPACLHSSPSAASLPPSLPSARTHHACGAVVHLHVLQVPGRAHAAVVVPHQQLRQPPQRPARDLKVVAVAALEIVEVAVLEERLACGCGYKRRRGFMLCDPIVRHKCGKHLAGGIL